MAHQGEAAGYYNMGNTNDGPGYPVQQPPRAYGGQQEDYNSKPGYGEQAMPPPPGYGQNYQQGPPPQADGNYDGKTFDQQFKVSKPKFNDIPFAIALLAVMAGFVVVSGISIQGYASTKSFNGDGIYGSNNEFGLSTNTIVLFAFVLGMALVLGYGYISLARMFTKQFIWITGILHIIFGFATAIYMLYRQYWSGGIVFLLFAIFTVICFISWIPRIPFSVLMLQTAIDVSRKFGHMYLVSFLGGLIAAAFGAWFSVTLVAVYVKFEPGNNPACNNGVGSCSSATVIGLLVFITFAGYWITEWLKNTIHATISGVFASWYFAPSSPAKGATRGAARRAMTYSFGSIAFGSLIVAIINMLKQACSIAQQQSAQSGNMATEICFCLLRCLIGLLEWAVRFFNRYAFSYLALYGSSYIESAKATWKLIKDRGIDALVNECLIGPVLTMGSSAIGYLCALLAYLYLVFTDPGYNEGGQFTPLIVAYAFLVGLQIQNCFNAPLNSGIDTIFVAAAWDPEVLMREHPELYHAMVKVYPHVQQAIHA